MRPMSAWCIAMRISPARGPRHAVDPPWHQFREGRLSEPVRYRPRHVRCRRQAFERVRVVPEPLTEYLRFGRWLAAFKARAGEDVRYVGRSEAYTLDLPAHDFWLFDGERLALLYFTADDRLLGAELVTQRSMVARHERWLDLAQEAATPYREYLAADPSRDQPQRGPD